MPPKKKSKIEKLKERLYSPKSKDVMIKPRGIIYDDPHVVSDNWKPEALPPVKKRKNLLGNTMFRKFFFGAIAFFGLSVAFGLLMFFRGANTVSADNIDIEVLGNAFVSGGEELPLKIQLINRNNVALEFSDLLLEYQKGAGAGEDIQRDRITVGTIPAGGVVEKLVNVTLFGSQGTTRDVNITLEYRVKGSSAIFFKQKPYVINISSTPVNLVVEGPEVTNSNQNISFSIIESLNTGDAVKGMMLTVHYPPGFDFKSATPEPTFSNNVWSLGDLSKGAEKVVTINGVIVADAGEERAFNIITGTKDPNNEQKIGTQFNSEDYIISIQKPFLDLEFAVNGNSEPQVAAQSNLVSEGVITLTNSLDTKMTDVEVTAKFSGNAFDSGSIKSGDAFYDSVNQTLIWNSQTSDRMASFDPGDRQELKFTFKPSASAGSIKNPEINIDISVKGRQPSLGNIFLNIDSYIKKKIVFGSSVAITGDALYHSGPFGNSGPIPPTPGNPTTYTIVWNVANTTNRIVNAKVRTTLPLYVDWVGSWSPTNQNVTFNTNTKEVLWDIGTIEPGVGTTSSPRQLYFQVRLNPSASQKGTTPNLILESTLSGKDSFTNADINKSTQPVNTRLNSDSNYNSQGDTVQ